jgi:hypothetical protein
MPSSFDCHARARRRASSWLIGAASALTLTGLVAPAAAAPELHYYGGPVISQVDVVQVAWSSGVDAAYLAELSAFYEAMVSGTYLDWLSEYDTIGKVGFLDGLPGSEQHIGRGTFGGAFVITPSIASTTLSDADISAELIAQIKSGALPQPKLDAKGFTNSVYMIDFPPGTTIGQQGQMSCAVFQAYHGTALLDGIPIPYGVHPDCDYAFDHATVVHSHELVEAITDPNVALNEGSTPARPAAWRTPFKNVAEPSLEISDLCNDQGFKLDGYTYTKNWSNFAGKCVGVIPICDGTKAPPACRPCTVFDEGAGCSGATQVCALSGEKAGQCVACTGASAAACTGETPLCDAAANACVGCLADSDCGDASAAFCDAETRSCRGCTSNSECKIGVCETSAGEHVGQCVACVADTDCGADERCTENACVKKPPPAVTPPPGSDGCSAAPRRGEAGRLGGWGIAALAVGIAARRRRRDQA